MTHALDAAVEIAGIVDGARDGDGTLRVAEAAAGLAGRLEAPCVREDEIGEAIRAEGAAAGLRLL